MKKMSFILAALLLLLGMIPLETHAQNEPQGLAKYPIPIADWNDSYHKSQQSIHFTASQVGQVSNTAHVDTTVAVTLPLLLEPIDTLRLALAIETNIDTLSYAVTAQFLFSGAPDSSAGTPNWISYPSASGMPTTVFRVQRKTTVTYFVTDFARIHYASIPPGATAVRFLISWQASSQSINSDGANTDQWTAYLVYPKRE